MQASNASVTGTRTGEAVSLQVGGLIGQTWLGTLRGDELTLQLPQRDGTLRSVAFSRSDPAAYDAALAQVRDRVRSARVAAAQQREEQERAAAQQRAEERARTVQAETAERAGQALAALDELEPTLTEKQRHVPGRLTALQEAVATHAAAVARVRRARGCAAQDEALAKAEEAYAAVDEAVSVLDSAAYDVDSAADDVESRVEDLRMASDDLREVGGTVPPTWDIRANQAAEGVRNARCVASEPRSPTRISRPKLSALTKLPPTSPVEQRAVAPSAYRSASVLLLPASRRSS